MAAVTGTVVFEEGTAEKVCVYRVKQVDTGDTLDVSAKFSKLTGATSVSTGNASPKVDVCAVANLVVTLDAATQTDETMYVTVIGDSA